MSDAMDRLLKIMDRLRGPGGCPWDREQDLQSLCPYLLEEAYEAVEAVESGDLEDLREELGDLLLQIVFMAKIGSEQSAFDFDEVADGISAKMIRRHPHVFGENTIETPEEVMRQWEEIKSGESRKKRARSSALDGVPSALPALLKAYRMSQKAASLGFDWERTEDVVAKLREEVSELEEAVAGGQGRKRIAAEMGDILFTMANLARRLEVEPETALQGSNTRFRERFRAMEQLAGERGVKLSGLTPAELDELWERAKVLCGES